MALSYIVSEIKLHIGEIAIFSYPACIRRPLYGVTVGILL